MRAAGAKVHPATPHQQRSGTTAPAHSCSGDALQASCNAHRCPRPAWCRLLRSSRPCAPAVGAREKHASRWASALMNACKDPRLTTAGTTAAAASAGRWHGAWSHGMPASAACQRCGSNQHNLSSLQALTRRMTSSCMPSCCLASAQHRTHSQLEQQYPTRRMASCMKSCCLPSAQHNTEQNTHPNDATISHQADRVLHEVVLRVRILLAHHVDVACAAAAAEDRWNSTSCSTCGGFPGDDKVLDALS